MTYGYIIIHKPSDKMRGGIIKKLPVAKQKLALLNKNNADQYELYTVENYLNKNTN